MKEFKVLHKAWQNLVDVIYEELKIKAMVEWLAKIL